MLIRYVSRILLCATCCSAGLLPAQSLPAEEPAAGNSPISIESETEMVSGLKTAARPVNTPLTLQSRATDTQLVGTSVNTTVNTSVNTAANEDRSNVLRLQTAEKQVPDEVGTCPVISDLVFDFCLQNPADLYCRSLQ